MLTEEIRRKFLQYFREQGHSIIPSSPVVPHDDPTLLFNNAGMNQFKDVFLGKSERDYKRAVTSQKCIRAGGKHNDLENVGHTSRHLTFFEMLGNFSFGDYFKVDAIKFAWEVSTKVFQLDPNRIWPTVFRDDDEAFEMWKKYVPADRITRFGEKENFWAMGDTGPCGPCSELLYDRGEHYGKGKNPSEDPDGERFLEFWNLVFMQYNRTAAGVMEPLPKPSIDTGAGLERVVSLKMNVESVFDTDVLRSLIAQVEQISGVKYDLNDAVRSPAFRVIADHLRCLAFAIADGVQPSNVDRGYVLRKVLRRAVRYGRTLGLEDPFLARVLPTLIETMGTDYPELKKAQGRITEILTTEEEAFIRTLRRGGNMLNQIIEDAKKHGKRISGEDAFKLKDTYGFPVEEILLIAIDADLSVDTERYQVLEDEAKERSRNAQKVSQQVAVESIFAEYSKTHAACKFLGFTHLQSEGKVTALVVDGKLVEAIQAGEEGWIILDQTPFYAEMGGQVGDLGTLTEKNTSFKVTDCKSPYKSIIAHLGILERGSVKLGDTVMASVDAERRQKIANNHTATHLLHWALHEVLGEHAKQAGSVVDASRLRFDFSHHKSLTLEEQRKIEDLVNARIRENHPVKWYEIPYEDAQKRHDIKQFFGEKYSSQVRVVDIDFSKELCGGVHVNSLGSIGLFRIAKEGSIAAGVRRIEAVTGLEAELLSRQSEDLLHTLATSLKIQPQKLTERIDKLVEENRTLQQELKAHKKDQLNQLIQDLLKQVETINQTPALFAEVPLSAEELRMCADEISAKLPSGVIFLASKAAPDKCHLIIRVSDDLVSKGVNAQNFIKTIAPIIEGTGGGKPNNAQAGGKAPQMIQKALSTARGLL
ncbi:MAG: alanine--tRNA ligase [Parachlamydiaceae bacterium]|nr:alanine--tRNA ligase [Parachlamydiaceae bacterium]